MLNNEIQAVANLAKEDQSFLVHICESNTIQDIQDECVKRNIVISEKDAQELLSGIESERDKQVDDLVESDLENVSGGFVVTAGTVFIIGAGLYGLYRAGKAVGKLLS